MLRVVTNQQELAKSKSKSYIDGGIKVVKATGIEDKKILFRGGPTMLQYGIALVILQGLTPPFSYDVIICFIYQIFLLEYKFYTIISATTPYAPFLVL